jgi:hypothetical protein
MECKTIIITLDNKLPDDLGNRTRADRFTSIVLSIATVRKAFLESVQSDLARLPSLEITTLEAIPVIFIKGPTDQVDNIAAVARESPFVKMVHQDQLVNLAGNWPTGQSVER